MGVADGVSGAGHDVTAGVGDAVSGAGEAIGDAPHHIAVKTQGNPLAAGLIAFGAGMLISSLFPASQKERQAAQAVKSAAEPLTDQIGEAAQNVAHDLKEPAQSAMENVKATATEAAAHIKEESHSAVGDVADRASEAKDNVQNT
jgi:ElaB/YqjD/DUF883 family membrane-anchored ribosome-binding protein